jgi:hypothetical protein
MLLIFEQASTALLDGACKAQLQGPSCHKHVTHVSNMILTTGSQSHWFCCYLCLSAGLLLVAFHP